MSRFIFVFVFVFVFMILCFESHQQQQQRLLTTTDKSNYYKLVLTTNSAKPEQLTSSARAENQTNYYSIIQTLLRSNNLHDHNSNDFLEFTYVDLKANRRIVILDDYIVDKSLNDFKLELNKNYLYSSINVFSTDEHRLFSMNRTFEITDVDEANSPLVLCSYLPEEFYECPTMGRDLNEYLLSNCTSSSGGSKLGSSTNYHYVPQTTIMCKVFDGIECRGDRSFPVTIPCIK